MIPDEFFFGTLACHPNRKRSLPISSKAVRFVNWKSGLEGHPKILGLNDIKEALDEGFLFARKFPGNEGSNETENAADFLIENMRNFGLENERLKRAKERLQLDQSDLIERPKFCFSRERVGRQNYTF
mmetsp:Transcript_8248/g.12497  ORF Transcript_8248/g.12497 Transcript_8248/m.12497 type:complete len:128 (+) Transcript_8248:1-384(+)